MENICFSSLEKYYEQNKNILFGTLAELIRINTENNRKSCNESALTSFVEKKLEKLCTGTDLYTPDSVPEAVAHPDFTPGKDFFGRENLTAKIAGKAPKKSLMLAAHADTMPIGDLSLWTVPPTDGIIKDGRIYGRGACDDKYALAAMIFFAKAACDLGIELNNDVYLTAYVDEEFGGGNGALAAAVKYPCDFYLNLDCKNLDIWNCAAGGQRIILHLAHPKFQHCCGSMIEALYIVKQEIDIFGKRRIAELKNNHLFDNSIIPETAIRYMNIGTGLNTNDRHKGVFDFAFYTDKNKKEIWKELEETFEKINARLAHLDIKIEKVVESSRFFTYGYVDREDSTLNLLKNAGKCVIGKELDIKPSCLSDLSLFLAAAPERAASFGAGRDFDVEGGAHLPNEFIECESLLNFAKIVAKFILEWDKVD
ncbi:MAG: M20 family metallopeptidase [Clostridia bacterium]|nr:M20 family metallopeptidase [Clostridia bacterium]